MHREPWAGTYCKPTDGVDANRPCVVGPVSGDGLICRTIDGATRCQRNCYDDTDCEAAELCRFYDGAPVSRRMRQRWQLSDSDQDGFAMTMIVRRMTKRAAQMHRSVRGQPR